MSPLAVLFDVILNIGYAPLNTGNGFRARPKVNLVMLSLVEPSRGPLLADWVGKVLGNTPVDTVPCAEPTPIPIDVDDVASDSGGRDNPVETGNDLDAKIASLESQISHLKRASVQSAELSCFVERLEAELNAALVERRESWPMWRQARWHQKQIDEAGKRLPKLEEREVEVVSKLDLLHQ